jgi:hypothetical protein
MIEEIVMIVDLVDDALDGVGGNDGAQGLRIRVKHLGKDRAGINALVTNKPDATNDAGRAIGGADPGVGVENGEMNLMAGLEGRAGRRLARPGV